MPTFSYKAKKGPNEMLEGTIEAENKKVAIEKLLEKGITPLRIEFTQVFDSGKPSFVTKSFSKVRYSDVEIFTRQLTSLIKSNITILKALRIIREQTENSYFKWIISKIETDIKEGEMLSEALKGYPKIFPSIFINIVRSGETSGALDEALGRLVEFREKEEEIRTKIKTALAYPVFLVIAGILTIFFMFTFFMPRLISLFRQMGQILPLPTRVLISLSDFSRNNWIWMAIGLFVFILLTKRKTTSKNERLAMDWIRLRLPLIGPLIKKSEISKFARALAVLIRSGIPIVKAIETSVPLVNSEVFRDELSNMNKEIISGSSLADGLKAVSQFSPLALNIIAVGEEGGRLEESLLEVASFYEKEVDRGLKLITSLIEPVIIIVIGAIVGFIVFAMLLPIFNIDMVVR